MLIEVALNEVDSEFTNPIVLLERLENNNLDLLSSIVLLGIVECG